MKKVALGCAIALGIAVVGIAAVGLAVWQFGMKQALRVPSQLQSARVLQNSAQITKKCYFRGSEPGLVCWIGAGTFSPQYPGQICVAGSDGAVLLDSRYISPVSGYVAKLTEVVKFPQYAKSVDVIDVDDDGKCEYLLRTGEHSIRLLHHNGATMWRYGTRDVDDVAWGDIDADGSLEFVVALNGIHLLDSNGRKVWHQPGENVDRVEIVDVNGDGRLDILSSHSRRRMTVRDAKGNTVSRIQAAVRVSDFSLSPWPTHDDPLHIIVSGDQNVFVLDFQGRIVTQLNAPHSTALTRAQATPVRFGKEQHVHFAVLAEFWLWEIAILYIYDSAGKLVYQEVYDTVGRAVSAVSFRPNLPEVLGVGLDGEMLVYDR